MPHGHAHGHSHASGHGHSHGAGRGHHHHAVEMRRLRWALVVISSFVLVEIVGGVLANSLALIADAGHMLTDVGALGLAIFVNWFSRRPHTPQKTFGYLRWEILAAFINGSTLLLLSAWIVWQAVPRLVTPQPLEGALMLGIAVGGTIVNLAAAWILHPSGETSMNVRGAYLHVLGDLLGSVGVVLAALIVHFTGWLLADPIASIVMTALIVRNAWRLVREAVDVLLESTPSHISAGAVRAQLEALPGVESVHDLHIWSVTSGVVAMSAHAIVREPERHQHVLEHAVDAMRLFGISHVTIQMERQEMYERELHLHP